MTRAELLAFVPSLWSCPTNLGANSYAVPTLGWLQDKCWPAFRSHYWAENLDKWLVRWECRDFARAFACFALECWATTQGGTTDDGLAIGEIWFIPDATKPTEGHAVCAFIGEDGLQFLDPQNGKLWPMSSDQFASRYFLRF